MGRASFGRFICFLGLNSSLSSPTSEHVCCQRVLDNEKDAMTSGCLDRKEVRGAIWGVHSTTDRPAGGAGGNTGRKKFNLHRTSFSDVWRAGLRRPVKHIVHWIGY